MASEGSDKEGATPRDVRSPSAGRVKAREASSTAADCVQGPMDNARHEGMSRTCRPERPAVLTRGVSDITLRTSPPSDGVIAWASVTINAAIVLEDIGVGAPRNSGLALRFPLRRSRCGEEYPMFYPATSEVRRQMEQAVVAKLRPLGSYSDRIRRSDDRRRSPIP